MERPRGIEKKGEGKKKAAPNAAINPVFKHFHLEDLHFCHARHIAAGIMNLASLSPYIAAGLMNVHGMTRKRREKFAWSLSCFPLSRAKMFLVYEI